MEAERFWVSVGLGARDTLRLEKGYRYLAGLPLARPEQASRGSPGELPVKGHWNQTYHSAFPPIVTSSAGPAWRKEQCKMCDGGSEMYFSRPITQLGHQVHSSENEDSLIGYITSGAPSPSLGWVSGWPISKTNQGESCSSRQVEEACLLKLYHSCKVGAMAIWPSLKPDVWRRSSRGR